jgi:membrane fusion protein (multidrug efflux system)
MNPWTGRLYWVLLALAGLGLAFAILGHVHEFATGPAIVLAGDAEELDSEVGGYVERVLVRPGDHVGAGQVLVQLNDTAQQSELIRAQEEFDLHLLQLLKDPSDESARQTLASLRPRLELARSDVQLRLGRAAHPGQVIDVRVRARQQVSAGDPLVTLSGDQGEQGLVALLPGVYRPQLKPGLKLRFRIVGGEEYHCDLVVREVSDQVIGPTAIRRFLGTEVGDAVAVPAASVVVRADLPEKQAAAAATAKLYPGMQGIAEVAVRDESILAAFIPGLKPLLERLR